MPAANPAAAPDLFGDSIGFRYAENILSPDEERDLVRRFQALPFAPFEFHGYQGNRRIVSYGHRYDYAARTLRQAEAIPDFLAPLKDAAGRFSGIPAGNFRQALITEYAPGAGIGWHRDKPMFEDVVGLSFLAPCTLRLRRKTAGGWERRAMPLAPRSAYLMTGPARHVWEHRVPEVSALRYSITFRTFAPASGTPVRA